MTGQIFQRNGLIRYNKYVRKILIYGLDEPNADKTQNILERQGIAAYVIGDDVLDQTVNSVFNAEEDFDGRHQEIQQSFMIFDGFELNGVLSTLDLLRRMGAEFDGVKVMRTDINSNWKMKDLLKRTKESFEVSKKAIVLNEVIQSCNGIDLSGGDAKARAEFKKALTDAIKLLQSGSYVPEQVDRVTHNLTAAMKGVRKLYN